MYSTVSRVPRITGLPAIIRGFWSIRCSSCSSCRVFHIQFRMYTRPAVRCVQPLSPQRRWAGGTPASKVARTRRAYPKPGDHIILQHTERPVLIPYLDRMDGTRAAYAFVTLPSPKGPPIAHRLPHIPAPLIRSQIARPLGALSDQIHSSWAATMAGRRRCYRT
jgi:hypothetical protein